MIEEIKKRIAAINSGIIPEGYKKTKVGIVPVEWEVVKLYDIGKNYIGLTYSPEDTADNGLIVLRSSNIRNSKIDLTDCVFVKCNVNDKNIVKTNDILICSRNGSSNLIGKSALITAEFSNLAFGAFMSIYRTQYYSYVFQTFQSFIIKKQIIRNLGARINQITISDLNLFRIPFPPLPEQQKIAEILSTQDKLIELQERKIEQLKTLKKGYLQKMFPKKGSNVPELRFKGFTDDWEQRELGECAEFNPKSELPDEFEYVDLESVVGTSMVSHRTEAKKSAPSRAQRLAKQGDVFYQMVRPYQKNNYLFDLPLNNYVFSTGYAQLRPYISPQFLMCLIQTEDFVRVVLDNCTGTSYPAINSNDLAKIEVTITSNEAEQQQIGTYFRNLDNLITLHQRKLDEEKQKKKALMQLLLTGKVRTII